MELTEKLALVHNSIMNLIIDSEIEPHMAMSVLMKMSASFANTVGMKQAEFLSAADLTYKIESFVRSNTDNLTMH